MRRRSFIQSLPAFTIIAGTAAGSAQDLQPIPLEKPQTEGGNRA